MHQIITKLIEIVGPSGVLCGEDVSNRPECWGSQNGCRAAAIVRPETTDEVSLILAVCYEANQPIVVAGGMTGLVEGAVASECGGERNRNCLISRTDE